MLLKQDKSLDNFKKRTQKTLNTTTKKVQTMFKKDFKVAQGQVNELQKKIEGYV